MRSRQRTLKRSGALEARTIDCGSAGAVTAGGTRTTAPVVPAKEDTEGFVLSVRESPCKGSRAGVEWLAEHWHGLPCEPVSHLHQQEHELPGSVEGAAEVRQQGRRVRDPQCATGVLSARQTVACDGPRAWFPQPQAMKGRDSAGTSTAASHTRIRVVRQSQKRTAIPRRVGPLRGQNCRVGRFARLVHRRQGHHREFTVSSNQSQ